MVRHIASVTFVATLLAVAANGQPTYSLEVSRIIQQKCQICHRPNDIAPYPLLTYQDALSLAPTIRATVDSRTMPPWKPIAGHGEFQNNMNLTDAERQTILDWVDAGAPEGDPANLPPNVVYAGEWRLGPPDEIVSMPVAYIPSARAGTHDRYRCFILPNVVDQDRWVRAVDIVPGARQMVHHVLLFLTDDPTQIQLAQSLDDQDTDPGYDCWGGPLITPGAGPGLIKIAGGLLGGWAPGASPVQLSPDMGILVPKGAYVIMQVHYNLHAVDSAPPDQTSVGLYFQAQTPKNRLLTLPLLNDQFVLQPGDVGKQVDAAFTLDMGTLGLPLPDYLVPKFSAVLVGPHMHTLGTHIRADMTQPDGTPVPMIEIDNWDFHYQGLYHYVAPVPMPYRSKISAACVFDNPTDHQVRWGESTDDEMCLVYFGFTAEGGLSPFLFGNPQ